jgi:hypothetical protein
MKADAILEEAWRIKDKVSREMAANPEAYGAKLAKLEQAEEKAGRKIIRSAEELRQLVAENERKRTAEPDTAFHDKPPCK